MQKIYLAAYTAKLCFLSILVKPCCFYYSIGIVTNLWFIKDRLPNGLAQKVDIKLRVIALHLIKTFRFQIFYVLYPKSGV